MKAGFLKIIIMIIFISTILSGCTKKDLGDKLIDSGLEAVENMEYSRAIKLFEEAKEEKGDKYINEDIDILIKILKDYKRAIRNYNAKNYDRAKEIIDNINEEYVNYKIKEDIEYLSNLLEKNR